MNSFNKTVLDNGIRVVTERHPQSRAASIGAWVTTGTRDEAKDEGGMSHLLEHLVFKGTKSRNAYQIVRSLEALGGDLNAYTTKEYTCYHALVLKEHWREALDILADLTCHMKISAKDFKLEKGVILQEIAMADDNQEDVINEVLFEHVYKGHSLSTPILGTVKSIAEMKLSHVLKAYRENYQGGSLIISAAGCIDHDAVVDAVAKLFRTKRRGGAPPRRRKPVWKRARPVVEKEGEQVHCLWAFPTVSYKDPRRYEAFIVNAALGGGMTSRLYQAVRERKGLVYNIHSALNLMADCGMITIYAGAEAAKVREVGEVVAREIRAIKRNGVSRADVEMFKTQVIGAILLGADDVENRMNSLGLNELVFGHYRPVDDVVEEVRAVTVDQVNSFAREKMETSAVSGVALGPGARELAPWWNELEF